MRNSVLPVTKVGPGEKERAYVVRQNLCLKIFLGVVILISILGTALIFLRYEVTLQRRHVIAGARTHREEEHESHMRVMRLSTQLQRHLEDEVQDANLLATNRAWLMRAIGDYQQVVMTKALEAVQNCSTSGKGLLREDEKRLRASLLAEGTKFDVEVEGMLRDLWNDMMKEGEHAKKQLHNITHAIMRELKQDATEANEFERVMRDLGEDPGTIGYHEDHHHRHRGHGGDHHGSFTHHNMHRGDGEDHYLGGEEHPEVEMLEEVEDDDESSHGHGHHRGHGETDEYGDVDEHHGSHHERNEHGGDGDEDDDEDAYYRKHEGRDDPDYDEDEHMGDALDVLYNQLLKNDSSIVVSNATLDSWIELLHSSERALHDEQEEPDMERINKRIGEAIAKSGVAHPMNDSRHGSELDYLRELIHKARLAPRRDELLGVLTEWRDGEARISVPLRLVEQLIDEDILDPEVLMMHHGGYEHYEYGENEQTD